MKNKELKKVITDYITGKIMDGSIKPDSAPDLVSFIEEAIDSREQYLIGGMTELTLTWEASMGSEDTTLYTLGLRRAIDLIRESDYKPINGDDVRDFKRPFDHNE